MIVFLLSLLLAGVFFLRRRRKSVLAGRVSAHPTYTVEPPRRSVGNRRTEVL